MYFVYILKCSDGSLYTGITTDLKRRTKEHNSSKLGAKYTRSKRPAKLVYFKKFKNRSLALKAEIKMKSLPRIEKIRIIERKNTEFGQKIYEIVKKIPKGKVLTYKQVAQMSGNIKAYRAVGNVLNKNYDSKIPCHRVIRSDKKIGGYNRGEKCKKDILKRERYLK